ncbi:divalent-cation tolerance protein CutA [Aliiglaciecola sp. LCG003]|uniref:divalent-cation tolerance protein CutA n=1 Tax=Aliiglaciecola sp. LCG003 TaxID=3053655 RepID=UPI002572DAB7|nr:divalent-cation tolerance protein CutA [Aliiglaciecola sp. LCG003]WJG09251.1 divalent-cation tolerance protein CutA [Aliiglaciecola sp. LCG003]
MNSEFCIVLTTCPTKKQAEKLAAELINLKLAACVQISQPVTSVYRWEDEIVTDAEMQVIIKTMEDKLDAAFKLTLSLHPYDIPQWIVLDSVSGSPSYLNWIKSSLQ